MRNNGTWNSAATVFTNATVLWTNDSPSSSFAAQNDYSVSGMTNYNYIMIIATRWNSSTTVSPIILSTNSSNSAYLSFVDAVYTNDCLYGYNRLITFNTNNTLTIGPAVANRVSASTFKRLDTDNTILVPYKIIGFN
jgi:hypothetical protein